MTSPPYSEVHFIGGPEDGRIISPDVLSEIRQGIPADDRSVIPVVMKMSEWEQPGDTEEIKLVGHYVARQVENNALQYVWARLD
ncbi:hypothetical protein OJ996_20415 [Luteolibacter sp. GHJ8]|uniref:Uncharacterized protein n=1 Tax=Luteolibacter rhizosphaerae TaxID=2989719 RepID=A0ABT3G7Y1_9BACT|nr:hypothetical protein [Luteolibacter rhizosphaerae]MCW1915963.1 hypothetical protein [Luteolibacter rhizosphaerae]